MRARHGDKLIRVCPQGTNEDGSPYSGCGYQLATARLKGCGNRHVRGRLHWLSGEWHWTPLEELDDA